MQHNHSVPSAPPQTPLPADQRLHGTLRLLPQRRAGQRHDPTVPASHHPRAGHAGSERQARGRNHPLRRRTHPAPQLAEIAQRSKASGALVSINTHGAHPALLERALPWIDELKLHIDSFNPQRQKHSMGLSIDKVLQSIERSRQHRGLRTVVNHPLQSLAEAREVIATTRQLGVECKLIELLDAAHACPQLPDIPWAALGYQASAPGLWQHPACGHRVMARRCNTQHAQATELFIGADGVRRQLQGQVLGSAQRFSLDMLTPQPPARFETHANQRPQAQVVRFFSHANRLATAI